MDLAWLLVVPAYLLGTFPTAVLVGRHEGHDVTSEGSGNPGAANASKVLGARWGAGVMAADIVKAAVAARAGQRLAGGIGGHVAGTAAVVGHSQGEVAAACGFESHSAFSRAYRQRFGTSATQTRRGAAQASTSAQMPVGPAYGRTLRPL